MGNFLDWVKDNPWSFWLGLALVLGIIETTTVDLIFLMLAGGAVAGGVASLGTDSFVLQSVIAVVVSLAMVLVVRPVAKQHLQRAIPSGYRTGIEALIGHSALVLDQVDAHHGRIKLGGEVWSARSYDGRAVIEPGQSCEVLQIDGATALVYPSEPSP